MLNANKIAPLLVIVYIAMASAYVYGQKTLSKDNRWSKGFTIGFNTGKEVLFRSSPTEQHRATQNNTSTLFLQKPIHKHINLETGIRYNMPENKNQRINNEPTSSNTGNTISVPVTIQYRMLQPSSRLRPYLGTGVQFNVDKKINNYPPFSSDILFDNNKLSDTRYIRVLFSEGILFQVNTKIQVTQSLHFVPGADNNSMAISIGVGFNL